MYKTKIYTNSVSILVFKDDKLITKTKSIMEASRLTNVKPQNIYKTLNGYKTTLNGYTFIKENLTIQDILRHIIGHKNYIFNIDNQNRFVEYGDLQSNNGDFYIDTVGTISFDEIIQITRDKKIEILIGH
jgi:hypothetical protein